MFWSRLFGVRLVKRAYRLERPLFFALQCMPLNRVRRKHGLPSLSLNLCRIFTDGDQTLYADIPELQPTYNRPDNHQYLGLVLWSPSGERGGGGGSARGRRRGVAGPPGAPGGGGGRNLLQVVLNGLADLPVTVIAATADRSDLDNIPANAYVADYPPGEAAAARSDVVICNGGSLTTQQALVAGVPVLGIASNLDQHLNMQAIEAAGAGLLLRTERLKARSVSAAVRQLLDRPGYRQSAQELAEVFGRELARFPQHVESALRRVSEGAVAKSAAG